MKYTRGQGQGNRKEWNILETLEVIFWNRMRKCLYKRGRKKINTDTHVLKFVHWKMANQFHIDDDVTFMVVEFFFQSI